jgi:hypothetical protein
LDNNNYIDLSRTTTANQLIAEYKANSTYKSVTQSGFNPTTWWHFAMTWSLSAGADGQFMYYVNGAQIGTTQTGLGAWGGTLAATSTIIGAAATTPVNVWSGYLAHAALWTIPLTPAQIASLAVVPL